tara:strand:+ start:42 stop:296 length:255 start_codon:yes stop_codon:yes gene_type:complete
MNEITYKIIDAMSDAANEGLTQKEIAKVVGCSVSTIQRHLTSKVWAKINIRRLIVIAGVLIDNPNSHLSIYKLWDKYKEQQMQE